MSFAVGQWPEPRAEDIYVTNFLSVRKTVEAATPLRGDNTGRVIWETCEYRDMMSSAGPVLSKFHSARRGRAHFRGEILGEVEDFHAKVKVISEPALESNLLCGVKL